MKKQILILSFLFLGACGSKTVKLLDANWASMKHPLPPAPQDKLAKIGPISEEYCMDAWTGSYGMMDEVVKKVEAKHRIDYIRYPSFTKSVGHNCVQVRGEAYRVTN